MAMFFLVCMYILHLCQVTSPESAEVDRLGNRPLQIESQGYIYGILSLCIMYKLTNCTREYFYFNKSLFKLQSLSKKSKRSLYICGVAIITNVQCAADNRSSQNRNVNSLISKHQSNNGGT